MVDISQSGSETTNSRHLSSVSRRTGCILLSINVYATFFFVREYCFRIYLFYDSIETLEKNKLLRLRKLKRLTFLHSKSRVTSTRNEHFEFKIKNKNLEMFFFYKMSFRVPPAAFQ